MMRRDGMFSGPGGRGQLMAGLPSWEGLRHKRVAAFSHGLWLAAIGRPRIDETAFGSKAKPDCLLEGHEIKPRRLSANGGSQSALAPTHTVLRV
jgi:hypothetical protein